MRSLAALLIFLPLAAFAQQPLQLEPVPEPPPPSVGVDENADAPGVTLQRGEDQYETMEMDGQQVIRVTQPNGWVYYLIEARPGDGPFAGANSTDNRIRVPQWRILQW